MQATGEILELLTKAKDMRLNIAIFIVSTGLLLCASNNLFALDSISQSALKGLFFVTSVRLVYGFIGLLYSFFQKRRENKELHRQQEINAEKLAIESKNKKEHMRSVFDELDVFQLFIIQELKKQNHVQVKKGASLFTLKNANIIYTPAVGQAYESASLTDLSKSILESELWENFDNLKFNALIRFFKGVQPEDLKHFMIFQNKDSIYTQKNTHSLHREFSDHERVFSKYQNTIIFLQPQRNYTYVIDPIAKQAIQSVFRSES